MTDPTSTPTTPTKCGRCGAGTDSTPLCYWCEMKDKSAASVPVPRDLADRVGEARREQCTLCGAMMTDWVDPQWAPGRICKDCDASHDPARLLSASVPPGASPAPAWIPGKYGYDRKGGCGCSWASDRHGDVCPEHGNPAWSAPETPAAQAEGGR